MVQEVVDEPNIYVYLEAVHIAVERQCPLSWTVNKDDLLVTKEQAT